MALQRRSNREELTRKVVETRPTSQREIVQDSNGVEWRYYPEPLPGIPIEAGARVLYGEKKWTFLGRAGTKNDDALLFDGINYLSLDHNLFKRSARVVDF